MSEKRIKRLNSLLKEVINEVVRDDVRNPNMASLTSISEVEVSKDLHHAKVYVSIIGSEKERDATLDALQSAAGYISVLSSKKVTLRYFPTLTFYLDSSVDRQMHIDSLLKKIHEDRKEKEGNEHEPS